MSRRARHEGYRLGAKKRSSLSSRGGPAPRRSRHLYCRRLGYETLEDRRLLAVLTVNSDLDNLIAGDGFVTLREALDSANTGVVTDLGEVPDPGFDEIVFDPALDGSTIMVDVLLGGMFISEDLEIDASALANGLTIDGGDGLDLLPGTGDGFSIFTVDDFIVGPTITVELIGLTLTGGDEPFAGGAVWSAEVLTVTGSTITGNVAGGDGGGIFNSDGFLTVAGSTIAGNMAAGGMGGGIGSFFPAGAVTVTLSTITGNIAATFGGGIAAPAGDVVITNSTVSGNAAGVDGGGLFKGGPPAALTVTGSTFSNNTSAADGGGLWIMTAPGATTTITNSTISGNAADDDGGGIYAITVGAGAATIEHSTITGNFADADGDAIGVGGGLFALGAGVPLIDHTIVAANLNGPPPFGPFFADDIGGPALVDALYSLIGIDTTGTIFNVLGTSLIGLGLPIDPVLAPLSNNGGPTLTHRLLPGSPAIDAGDPAFVGPPAEDQRGAPFVRVDPTSALIDIGAYELQSYFFPFPFPLFVNTLVDESDGDYGPGDLSLREAIGLANGNVGFIDPVAFDAALAGGTIVLSDVLGEMAINDAVVIDAATSGGRITIDAGNGADGLPGTGDGFRIFNVNDFIVAPPPGLSFVNLIGLTLTGGDVAGDGGAIWNTEELFLTNSRVLGNAATGDGGGIYSLDGPLTLDYSLVSGNMAGDDGGGVFATSGAYTIALNNSTISGNVAGGDGGGAYIGAFGTASVLVSATTISGNTAGMDGGGIALLNFGSGTYTVNSTISGNAADGFGGGIFVIAGPFSGTTINHSTITGNTANADAVLAETGGGINFAGPLSLSLGHTIVAANVDGLAADDDIAGPVDATYSLVGIDTTGTIVNVGGTSLIGLGVPIDPLLAPLGNNGGPTLTHRLLPGSPAIDGGDPAAVAGALGVPLYDQRVNPVTAPVFGPFFSRVDASGAMVIDIGAYELQNVGPLILFVETLVDENDGIYFPGDLSLREAIGLANGNVGFDDTVSFGPALTSGTILLADLFGELEVTEGAFIDFLNVPGGGGVTIDAGNGADDLPGTGDGFRIFNIEFADPALVLSTVGLSGLTLTGGDVTGAGGAIRSLETLIVTYSTVTGNATSGFLGFGGGIYAGGVSTTITSSTISGNSTSGVFSFGGGIAAGGTLMVIDSTISANSTTGAPSGGGGIWAATAPGSAMTVTGSTISGNTTAGDGGGILAGPGEFTIESSTISGNSAAGDGGGIRATGSLAGKSIRRSTVTGNTAGLGGEGIFWASYPGGTLALDHTIVAGNTAGGGLDVVKSIPFVGTITASYSLIGVAAVGALVNVGGSSLVGTVGSPIAPGLGPLAANGGPTMTHALLAGSPAIEAGDPAAAGGYDQRGWPYTRVYDGDASGVAVIDIGAYELHLSPPTIPALLGDYNRNNVVDAADYVLWRDTLGTGGVPAFSGADGDGDGTIDDADRLVWRANFGNMLPPGAGSGAGEESNVVESQGSSAGAALSVAAVEDARGEETGAEQVVVGQAVPDISSFRQAEPDLLAEAVAPGAGILDFGLGIGGSQESKVESRRGGRGLRAEGRGPESSRDDALVAWLATLRLPDRGQINVELPISFDSSEHQQLDAVDAALELMAAVGPAVPLAAR